MYNIIRTRRRHPARSGLPPRPRRNPARLKRLPHVFPARTRPLPSGRRRSQLVESLGTVRNWSRERLPNWRQNFTVSLPFGWRGHWGRCGAIGCIGSKLDREKMPVFGKVLVKFSTLLGVSLRARRPLGLYQKSVSICVYLRLSAVSGCPTHTRKNQSVSSNVTKCHQMSSPTGNPPTEIRFSVKKR